MKGEQQALDEALQAFRDAPTAANREAWFAVFDAVHDNPLTDEERRSMSRCLNHENAAQRVVDGCHSCRNKEAWVFHGAWRAQ